MRNKVVIGQLVPFHKLNKKLKSEDTSSVSSNHTIRTKAEFDISSVGSDFCMQMEFKNPHLFNESRGVSAWLGG
jgi:hypothetical protein